MDGVCTIQDSRLRGCFADHYNSIRGSNERMCLWSLQFKSGHNREGLSLITTFRVEAQPRRFSYHYNSNRGSTQWMFLWPFQLKSRINRVDISLITTINVEAQPRGRFSDHHNSIWRSTKRMFLWLLYFNQGSIVGVSLITRIQVKGQPRGYFSDHYNSNRDSAINCLTYPHNLHSWLPTNIFLQLPQFFIF